MQKPRRRIRKSDINYILRLFAFSRSCIGFLTVIFVLGVSCGIAYEKMVEFGTWQKFHPSTESTEKINVCFTPPSGCGSLIAQEISKANETIYVQAYGLTSIPIIKQLKAAQARGVKVHVLLDGGNLSNNNSIYHQLKAASIDVALDKMRGIAHNKVMIIDSHKVITGSFNFTKAADISNAENVLFIDDPSLAAQYLSNWQSRKKHSLTGVSQ